MVHAEIGYAKEIIDRSNKDMSKDVQPILRLGPHRLECRNKIHVIDPNLLRIRLR